MSILSILGVLCGNAKVACAAKLATIIYATFQNVSIANIRVSVPSFRIAGKLRKKVLATWQNLYHAAYGKKIT